MPGIIGFKRSIPPDRAQSLLGDMARALEPEDRFQFDGYADEEVAMGRVSLRIVNPGAQPLWNEAHTIALVMEGELYDTADLRSDLEVEGVQLTRQDDPELILNLYETYGPSFAARLNGIFALALWDSVRDRLLVINDRLGMYPLYYARLGDGLLFGSGVRALLAEPGLDRAVDPVTIGQLLTFDHALFDRTLLTGVKLLPQGSILTYGDGQFDISPYWQVRYPGEYENRSERALLEQLNQYTRQAVARQKPGEQPAGMLLSGGLDSRALLAFLRDGPAAGEFHTFTWGIPGCDDARIAAEVAAKLGTRHHFFELQPDYLLTRAEEAIRITDGLGNMVNLHALATAERQARHASVIYKGFLGDALLGFALQPPHWADYDRETRREVHLGVHAFQGVITFNKTDQERLFTPAMQRQIGCAVFEQYEAGMEESKHPLLGAQRLHFDLRQRVPRMTLNGVEVIRSHAHVRTPFADNDLVDFGIHTPPGFLFDRALMRTAFLEAYPGLAKIPLADTGLPMIACARDVWLRTRKLAQWHLRRRGLGRLAGPVRRPYKDYNQWFRTVLRNWLEGLLLEERFHARGYYNPDYVRELVARHMAGEDHTIRLGMLASIELWHRQFLD